MVVSREGSKGPKPEGRISVWTEMCPAPGGRQEQQNLSNRKGIRGKQTSTPGGGAQSHSDVSSWHLNKKLTHQMS